MHVLLERRVTSLQARDKFHAVLRPLGPYVSIVTSLYSREGEIWAPFFRVCSRQVVMDVARIWNMEYGAREFVANAMLPLLA